MAKLTETSSRPSAVVLGDPKSGKTRLIGTLCQIVPTLVVTADSEGLDTLRSMEVNPEVVLLKSWDTVWDSYLEIARYASKEGYKALALDDFGAMQKEARHRIEMQPRERESSMPAAQRSQAITQALLRGQRRMYYQQWGELAIALDSFLYEMVKLPFSFVLVTATTELHRHPMTGEEHIYPGLQGSIRYDMLARFGLVGVTFNEEQAGAVHFCLTCRPHPRIPTGTRYGEGRTWVDPTAEKLLKHLYRRELPEDKESALERTIGSGIRANNNDRRAS